jgi:hypothetical protein
MGKRVEWWAFVALLVTATIVGVGYDRLPERVISPFLGPSAELGDKKELWLLVVLAIVVYAALSFVRFIPPVPKLRRAYMTEATAQMVQDAGSEMASWMKLETMVLFVFIALQDVQRAAGRWVTYWPWLLAAWAIAIWLTVRRTREETHKKLLEMTGPASTDVEK